MTAARLLEHVGRLGRNVALLAVASLLADVSGEMLMSVFPFLLVAQGATGLGLGLAGGAADAVGHLVKPLAGAWADRARRRKPFIVTGYLAAALSRLGIALSGFWLWSALFRASDRVGKGLRTAPRDALLAESVPKEERGRAFGVHRAADTAGAFVGAGLALVLLWQGVSSGNVVLLGALVGLATILPLAFVRDVETGGGREKALAEPTSPRYRAFLAVAGLYALGQVSYLFFLLRVAPAVGGAVGAVALYLLFNAVYALVAYPAGRLGDRVGRPPLLAAGFVAFAASAALLVPQPTLPLAVLSFVLLGLAFGLVDGTERALAADLAGSAARSTQLGIFHATVGVCAVAGGLVAGLLWDRFGERAAFVWGAVVPLVALAALLPLLRAQPARS